MPRLARREVSDDSARERLADRERSLRGLYAKAIEAQFEAVGVAPPAPAADLESVVQALDHWLPVQQALDAVAAPDDALFDALALLFRAALVLAEQQAS